jgi:hypothetical protein
MLQEKVDIPQDIDEQQKELETQDQLACENSRKQKSKFSHRHWMAWQGHGMFATVLVLAQPSKPPSLTDFESSLVVQGN